MTFVPLMKCTRIPTSIDWMHTYLLRGLHWHTRCVLSLLLHLSAWQLSGNPQAGSRISPMYSNPFFLQNASALLKTWLWQKAKGETDISWYLSSVFLMQSFILILKSDAPPLWIKVYFTVRARWKSDDKNWREQGEMMHDWASSWTFFYLFF